MKRIALCTVSLMALTACGGGGTPLAQAPAVPDEPVEVIDILLPTLAEATSIVTGTEDMVTATVSPDQSTITLNVDGEKLILTTLDNQLDGAILQGGTEVGPATLLVAVAENEDATVGYLSGSTADNIFEVFTFAERENAIFIPATGVVEYSGEYVGTLANVANITGDAVFTADFANSEISGGIVNRQVSDIATGSAVGSSLTTDVTFATTTFDDMGVFSGAATGGNFDIDDEMIVTSNGQINGLFVGDNASGVVGTYTSEFTIDETTGHEVGAFIAE